MLVWGFRNCYLAERGFRNYIYSTFPSFGLLRRRDISGLAARAGICSTFGLWLACAVLTGPL